VEPDEGNYGHGILLLVKNLGGNGTPQGRLSSKEQLREAGLTGVVLAFKLGV